MLMGGASQLLGSVAYENFLDILSAVANAVTIFEVIFGLWREIKQRRMTKRK